ncbi:GTPase-activating protein [Podochytrium sp. JEL0797]|nr:GTPase-activating protein [Podochytrium sp. JEL0797]
MSQVQVALAPPRTSSLQHTRPRVSQETVAFDHRVAAPAPGLRGQLWISLGDAESLVSADRYSELVSTELRGSVEKTILLDVSRTFPDHPLFASEEGRERLFAVLKAYALLDVDCGYCQGMSFVVAPLLMQNEVKDLDALRILVRLLDDTKSTQTGKKRFALRSLFLPEMPGLHLLLHQHWELVREFLPTLHDKLVRIGITPTAYASPWFLTLFTYSFPLPLVFRIYDLILSEGAILILLKISLTLLRRNELRLLSLENDDFEGALDLLKGSKVLDVYMFKREGDVASCEDFTGGNDRSASDVGEFLNLDAFVQDVLALDSIVTESVLAKLTASYFAQKQISANSAHEIQTLRANVEYISVQNESLFQETLALRLSVSKIQRECDARVSEANSVAAMEMEKRRALEAEVEELRRRLEYVGVSEQL